MLLVALSRYWRDTEKDVRFPQYFCQALYPLFFPQLFLF